MKQRTSTEHFLLSILFFFIGKLLLKSIPGIPSFEIVLFRALISLVICTYIIRRNNVSFSGTNRKDLFLRGFFGTAGMLTFFYSLQHLPLATATGLINLYPIFTIFLATVFLKEKIKTQDWVLFCIAFLGVLLLKGFNTDISPLNFAIGIFSAFMSSIAYIFVRRLKDREDPNVVVFSLSFVAIPIFLPLSILFWVTPTKFEWMVMISIGIMVQIAQINLTKALQGSKTTSSIMHYSYLDVVISAIAGYVLFHEEVTKLTIIGITIIIGCVYLLRESHKKLPV